MSHLRCTHSYRQSTAQTADFVPGWMPPSWVHGYNASIPVSQRSRLERAFLYTSPADNDNGYGGLVTSYPSGGYVADLSEDPDEASRLLDDLESNQWIDQYTRAVLVEFNILNPNSKLFNQVIFAGRIQHTEPQQQTVQPGDLCFRVPDGRKHPLDDQRQRDSAVSLHRLGGRCCPSLGDRLRHLCFCDHHPRAHQGLPDAPQVRANVN